MARHTITADKRRELQRLCESLKIRLVKRYRDKSGRARVVHASVRPSKVGPCFILCKLGAGLGWITAIEGKSGVPLALLFRGMGPNMQASTKTC